MLCCVQLKQILRREKRTIQYCEQKKVALLYIGMDDILIKFLVQTEKEVFILFM